MGDNETGCFNGLLLPILDERSWSNGARAFLYLLALLWCFLGVAIIADVFMCAIERITSKTRIIRLPDASLESGYREIPVKVWNDTVANLSLLALGTSAPEILLSVIEIVGNNMEAGELGPGTIVGSAAFNLLVITGICIVSIPKGEIRRVANMKVFGVTAFTCVFAYVWLIIILKVSSPNIIELWEAILTLLMFPTLIIVAFLADKSFYCGKSKKDDYSVNAVEIGLYMRRPSLAKFYPHLARFGIDRAIPELPDYQFPENYTAASNGPEKAAEGDDLLDDEGRGGRASIYEYAQEVGKHHELSEDKAAKLLAAQLSHEEPHGKGWYRINASREMTGGRKLIPMTLHAFHQLYKEVRMTEEEKNSPLAKLIRIDLAEGGTKPVVEFTAAATAVMESDKQVRVGIRRYGRMDTKVKINLETIDGTAVSGEDYKSVKTSLEFAVNEKLKELYIEIVDDYEWEPDEFFFVKLTIDKDQDAVVGNISINQVTIIDDDEPGKLEFASPSFVIKESQRKALIPVRRFNGCDGHVSVKWRTKDMTAKAGKHFTGGEGVLEFNNGETNKAIEIPIVTTQESEREDSFAIELIETTGGAELGRISKTIVTLVNDEDFNGLVSRIVNLTTASLDALRLDDGTWREQFIEAMNVNGGDVETAKPMDYIMHFCTFFWKVLFACVPPASLLGGWPTFIIALGVIGLMTAIIGDLAAIFGCIIGLPAAITAITFVALGTSMPDTFASKTAAIMEKTADSSVGNINGSNSVNVFLGLGLPWTIAAIYHMANNRSFKVDSGSLAFSVVLYLVAAIMAISTLLLRRFLKPFGQAELGGPTIPKYATAAFVSFLWILYVVLSAMQAKNYIQSF